MKKLLPVAALAFALMTACGTPPGQLSANNRVSIGVAAGDSGSVETATKTVTPATEDAPEKISWTITPGKGVTFTFMTRPGSDAAYITGYRILEEKLYTAEGTTTNSGGSINKMDVYLTSGYSCTERTALRSCTANDTDIRPDNGVPAQHSIYLESGLGNLARATDADVTQVTSIEFIGTSSNGAPVSVKVDGIVSSGNRAGDE